MSNQISVATLSAFEWRVRIYWEDTDAGGVVYHANYLRFMERARSEWLRAQGVDQQAWQASSGLAFMVRDMQLEWLKPARLDDELLITVVVQEWRAASILFTQEVIRASDAALLLRARARIACVDTRRLRPVPIPADLLGGRLPKV